MLGKQENIPHYAVFKFFIPSNCSDNATGIHFNFNLELFALVRRAPSGISIIYATVNKAIVKHYKGIRCFGEI